MLLTQIQEIVREAGKIMLDADLTEGDVSSKEGRANLVTRYDVKVQEFLFRRLAEVLPEAVFIGEEQEISQQLGDGYSFIIDPIDGTTNFVCGCGFSCISVALLWQRRTILGVIYNPYSGEMFWAEQGKGAFLNGKPIHVSERPLSEGIAVLGTSPYYTDKTDATFSLMRKVFDHALDIRRSGSAALDLCYVAAGRCSIFFEYLLSPWDFAAGSLIVTEAGGVFSDFEGNVPDYTRKTSIIAGSAQNCQTFLSLLD